MSDQKKAIIIGAGPAGLTAAYELASRTNYKVVVLEESDMVGGISRTVNYKGNRMDIGGHRFFSKSDRVMEWWLKFLPVQDIGSDPTHTDRLMLVRNRLSRIFYLKKFFNYPIKFNWNTISNLGFVRIIMIVSVVC